MVGETFYELIFPEITFSLTGNTMLPCPFPHKLPNGQIYYETNPSMGINIEKGVFNCFSCHAQGNEIQFIAKYFNISTIQANKLKEILDRTTETKEDWKKAEERLNLNTDKLDFLKNTLKFSSDAIKDLHIGLEGPGKGFSFPVFFLNRIIDVISYNPGEIPKVRKRPNSTNGFIMPYKKWKENKKHTVIVAGQKDLAIALSKNINAITITGGEGQIPELFLNDFKNKHVYIIYDNDNPGKLGSKKVAMALKPYALKIKIIDLSKTCTEKGEDLWDYFVKYKKTKEDLTKLIQETKEFTEEDCNIEKEKQYPTVSLREATKEKFLNKTLRSNIQVLATDENKFLMPTATEGEKFTTVGDKEANNQMAVGEKKYWFFENSKTKTLFYLIDSNLKEHQVRTTLKSLLRLPPKELGVKINIIAQEPVYKCVVTDQIEAGNLEAIPEEYVAYSIGQKLESGKKYKITYKLIPHPFQGNTLNMVITNVEESQDAISNFKLTKTNIENLKKFQVKTDLKSTINSHIEKVKGITRADYDNTLIKLIDFWFNTALAFNLGNKKNLRAYLDVAIVGESRTGKSSTAQALQQMYGVCNRIPLNGHNASIAGIIGGSQKSKNGYRTRAGVIPQNHLGGLIFEELAKASKDLLKELTEIRSSGWATITRVNGTINLPARVRMLSLSNTVIQGSVPRPITSYPNGIEILTDIVGSPEDIARYDMIGILPDKGANTIDPFFNPPEPFTKEEYRSRIHWIWSRKAEQIEITKDIYTYTIKKSNELNKTYKSYIKLFGTETYLKLLRIAIAVAGYVVSTDDSFEKIIIKKEHIDYAAELLIELYDNKTFRFKEYVDAERKFTETDQEAINELQKLWQQNTIILTHLENYSSTNNKTLKAVSGLDDTLFNSIMSSLTTNLFIRYEAYNIIPTERFRKTMTKIDRTNKERLIRL